MDGFPVAGRAQLLAADDIDPPLAGKARVLVPDAAAEVVPRPVGAEVVSPQPHKLVDRGRRRVVPRHRRRVGRARLHALLLLRLLRLHRLNIRSEKNSSSRVCYRRKSDVAVRWRRSPAGFFRSGWYR